MLFYTSIKIKILRYFRDNTSQKTSTKAWTLITLLNNLVRIPFSIAKSPFIEAKNQVALFRKQRGYFRDIMDYFSMNNAEFFNFEDLWPYLDDKATTHPMHKEYFLQDTWCAKKILKKNPEFHVDVGSTTLLVGFLSQFTKTYSVDIRPIPVELPGLISKNGSVLEMPFESDSIPSLSSLCVLEHIGLGRYGDPLDPEGSFKAFRELQRVLKKNGDLYISVPITNSDMVFYNAHKTFSYKTILNHFSSLALQEMLFVHRDRIYTLEEKETFMDSYSEYTFGLFHFRKP